MLTALALVGGAVGLLVVLLVAALVAPVRFGFDVLAADRLDVATGGVRFYGGLVGVGARYRLAPREAENESALRVGLLFWRLFVPVRAVPVPDALRRGKPQEPEPVLEPREAPTVRHAPVHQVERAPRIERETPVRPAPKPIQPSSHKTPRSREPGAWGRFRAAWEEWMPLVRTTLPRLRGAIRLRAFRAVGTVGAGDPALTGQLLGAVSALRAFEGRSLRLKIEPDFDRPTAAGRLLVEWRLSMRRVLWAGLFVGWKLYRRSRRAARAAA